jgi:hypothetical protein
MIKYLLVFLLASFQVLGQSRISNVIRKETSNNNVPHSLYNLIIPVDAFSNTVSFVKPANVYYDGNLSSTFTPGYSIYYPCKSYIELGGSYTINNLKVFDKNTGVSFTVKSGNDIFSLTEDTTITLNTGAVRTINMKNKTVKYLSYTLNTVASGPSEVEIYGFPVSVDAVPALTLRPNQKLENFLGWNADEFTAHFVGYDSNSVREYEYVSKHMRKAGGNIFSFNPGYDQRLNFEQRYTEIQAAGRRDMPLFFDALDYDSVFKPGYTALGQSWTPRYRQVVVGRDKFSPKGWQELARHAYQFSLRYGKTAGSTANTRLEPDNTALTGLGLIHEWEIGNEKDQWWDSDTSIYETPLAAYAKMTAVLDGDEGRLGARHGAKIADPTMQIVQGALADFNYGIIKSFTLPQSTIEPIRNSRQMFLIITAT